MGKMEGRAEAHIESPPERCYAIAADIDRIHEWQGGVQSVAVLERDGHGRAVVAELATDAKVTTVKTRVRFSYDPPHGLSWTQEKGDLKSLDGSWHFEADGESTRVTYELVGDPGRMLGMLIRGPVEAKLRDLLVNARPAELKARAEG
jgi:ribosome-associated toxin RatA of RatAB toxin-antitoxin module